MIAKSRSYLPGRGMPGGGGKGCGDSGCGAVEKKYSHVYLKIYKIGY